MDYLKCVKVTAIIYLYLVISFVMHLNEATHLNRVKRVVNGKINREGEWPFLVSLKNQELRKCHELFDRKYMNWDYVGSDAHICGATIISDRWLVSAYHCVRCENSTILDKWTAAISEYNLLNKSINAQYIPIEEIILPPQNNDLADIIFLKLKRPLRHNKYAQSICIKQGGLVSTFGLECVGMGWGTNYSIEKTYVSPLPRHYRTKYITTSEDCISETQTPESICFGPIDGFGCRGDSGGPLVCRSRSSMAPSPWQLIGVTSRGSGCNSNDDRIFFTNVTYFIHMLPANLINLTLCQSPTSIQQTTNKLSSHIIHPPALSLLFLSFLSQMSSFIQITTNYLLH